MEHPRAERGFTLIELLIVIAIIGIIAAIAIPNLLNALNRGKQARAVGEIRTLAQGIAIYQQDQSSYPAIGETVIAAVLPHIRLYVGNVPSDDPWRNPYQYATDGRVYTVISFGLDRVETTPYVNGPTGSFDADIVLATDSFYQYPEGVQSGD